MSIFEVWLAGYGVIFVLVTLLWLVSVAITNASIVDIFWGFGFVVLAWSYFLLNTNGSERQILVLVLVTVWGLRLTIHLARRNIGKGEDYRYQNFRKQYGESYWWKGYFQTFLLQGTLMVIIVAPVLVAMYQPMPQNLVFLDWLGVIVWLIGIVFEAVGDWQLARFKAIPGNKGKVLRTGLWRFTRHPNYFGDAMVWWGLFLIALAVPYGWLSIVGPVLMTFLLMRVSGVSMLEKTLKETKPEYQNYVRCTSAFFPMPPKC